MFVLQVLVPVGLLGTIGRRDRFARASAAEALNLQLIWFGLFIGMAVATTGTTHSQLIGWLTIGAFTAILIYAWVCGVVGAKKAWRGEYWRYPINLRLVPGSVARNTDASAG